MKFALPPLSREARKELRRAQTVRDSKFSIGGTIKVREGQKPPPITLRRADYEKAKGPQR